MTTKEQALLAADAASEKKAMDITILDLQGISLVADYFIICSGSSDIQVRAIAQTVEERMEEKEIFFKQKEGYDDARWILIDYADLVVHIFQQQERDYYQLERLWADASEVSYQQIANS